MSDIEIMSNDDGSVTVTHGAVTAHIRAPTWSEANRVAQALRLSICTSDDMDDISRRLMRVSMALYELNALSIQVERSLRMMKEDLTK